MASQDASAGHLSELEAQLRAPDSIMEPGVLELLKEYLRGGGKPQAAIEDLSENYEGYAQMCNLLCQWLEIADVQQPDAGGRPGGAGGAPAAAQPAVPDAFTLLQELAKDRFEPSAFLGVFRRGHPEWLNGLIADPRGRGLMYALSASHRNSLLLNYAIQRILKQGHEDEVSLVGGSLASYFEVYHRLLASRLAAATRATSAAQLTSLCAELSDSCVASQHTYVHAQQLLGELAACPGGRLFRRLGQAVEAAAVARHGGAKVYQLRPLFAPLTATPLERQAVLQVSEVLIKSSPSLPGGGQLQPSPSLGTPASLAAAAAQLAAAQAPLVALQALYEQQQGLSVAPLRHPQLVQLLLSGMFAADAIKLHGDPSAPRTDLGEVCIRLLALAATGPGRLQPPTEQDDFGAAAAAAAAGEDGSGTGSSPQPQAAPQRSAAAVAALLRDALRLAGKVASAKLGAADLEAATEVCKEPIAAVALMQHSQQLLGEPSLYAEEKVALLLPNHLSLLHRVACEQPGLIPQVLGVLRSVLTALGHNRQELSKSVLAFLVSLLVSGAADAALAVAVSWSDSADPSLIRHFIQLVLGSVAPPYSPAFARAMLAVMHKSLITRMKASNTAMLAEFAAGCQAVTLLPPLTKRDLDLLDELAK